MGLFKRNKHGNSLSAVDVAPVLFEPPQSNPGELEQMVYSVYEEKLDLERQLEAANKRIKELEETQTKLRASETFSRQSETERKKAESKNDELRREIERLEDNLKRSRSHATTLQLKLDDLQKVSEGQMREYRRKLIDEMKQRVPEWTGRWTQARVVEFLESCAHEQGEKPFYKRGGVFAVDEDNAGQTGGGE
jgi:predicted RNase H-like nuclease (RuvC/YqgF family)